MNIIYINNKTELVSNLSKINKNTTFILRDGIYNNIYLDIAIKGDINNKIIIKAENNNKVIFDGIPNIKIRGSYINLIGITFDNLNKHKTTIEISGNNNYIINCAFFNYNFPLDNIINIQGKYHRITNCIFQNITSIGLCINIYRPDNNENYILIDNNKFNYRKSVSGIDNELEIIRIGSSEKSLSSSKTMIINNCLNECDGEIEAISIKSGENIIFGNELINSKATITLRHGNNNYIIKNKIDGCNKKDSGGIRIIGQNHIVLSNLITNIYSMLINNIAICICNGQNNPALNGYWTPNNCIIKNNIIFKCYCCFGIGCKVKSDSIIKPSNILISNNKCIGDIGFHTSKYVLYNNEPEYKNNLFNVKYLGNISSNKNIVNSNFNLNINNEDFGNKYLETLNFNFEDTNLNIYKNLKKIIESLNY